MHSLLNRIKKTKRGSALLTVTIFALLIGFALASLLSFAMARRRETARLLIYNEELNVAEHVLDRAIAVTYFVGQSSPRQFAGDTNGVNTLIGELSQNMDFDGYNVSVANVQNQSWADTPITQAVVDNLGPQVGQWIGYTVGLESYQLVAGASATDESNLAYSGSFKRPGVYVSRNVSYFAVPLLRYAIFYENMFELDGGAAINVFGRVHTNKDWYLTTSSQVYYHSFNTVAGRFFGGIYNPLDGDRRGWYTRDSKRINIASDRSGSATPDAAATTLQRLRHQSTSSENKGFLSSHIYNPSDTDGTPRFPGNSVVPNDSHTDWDVADWDSDGDGTIDDMNNDGVIDTRDGPEKYWDENPDWVDTARSLFDGFLRDRSHGVDKVRLPISTEENPYLLVEPPGYESQIDPRDDDNMRPVYDVTTGQGVFTTVNDADADSDPNVNDPRLDKFRVNLAYQASVIFEPQPGWDSYTSQTDMANALKAYADDPVNNDPPVKAYRLDVTQANDGTVTITKNEFTKLYWQEDTDNDGVMENHTFFENTQIYNGREEKDVNLFDIDVTKMSDYFDNVTAAQGGFNLRNPNTPVDEQNSGSSNTIDDGIIYVFNKPNSMEDPATATSDYVTPSGEQPGVRIKNAADLSVITSNSGIQDYKGISIATNAPMYTKGDVNDTNKIPLMLAGDSINILSNSFSDSTYSSGSGNGPRANASSTETNAVFVSGNVPTKYRQYGGGGENYYRYLERWSGDTHTYRGSMLNLWESRVATVSWDKDTGNGTNSGYYSPPVRNWGWDVQFAAGQAPPGIPTSRQVSIGKWQLLSAAEFVTAGGTSVAVDP